MKPIDMIDDEDVFNTLYDAAETYGAQKQFLMAIEEMSELTKEICKWYRGQDTRDRIAEEMADVYIMLTQMQIILKNTGEIEEWVKKKARRLQERLDCFGFERKTGMSMFCDDEIDHLYDGIRDYLKKNKESEPPKKITLIFEYDDDTGQGEGEQA